MAVWQVQHFFSFSDADVFRSSHFFRYKDLKIIYLVVRLFNNGKWGIPSFFNYSIIFVCSFYCFYLYLSARRSVFHALSKTFLSHQVLLQPTSLYPKKFFKRSSPTAPLEVFPSFNRKKLPRMSKEN